MWRSRKIRLKRRGQLNRLDKTEGDFIVMTQWSLPLFGVKQRIKYLRRIHVYMKSGADI